MLSIPDMAILGAAALIFFGPEQLPRVARKAGLFMRDVQNTSQSFIREMERAADEHESGADVSRAHLLEDPIPHSSNGAHMEPAPSYGAYMEAAPNHDAHVEAAPNHDTLVEAAPNHDAHVEAAPNHDAHVEAAPNNGAYTEPAAHGGTHVEPASGHEAPPPAETIVAGPASAGHEPAPELDDPPHVDLRLR